MGYESKFIEKAERNLVNICKMWDDVDCFTDALQTFGNRMTHEYIGKKDFFDGLQLIIRAISAERADAIAKVFCFVGVGGEEAKEYSKKQFEDIFGEKNHIKYSIMHFLDKYGQTPSWYSEEDDKEFRKQAKDILK